MVGAVAGRAVAVAVARVVAWQEPVERGKQVVVRAGADFDDHQAGRGVGYEGRQQPVAGPNLAEERLAGAGQVGQPAVTTGVDRQLTGVYGKTLRSASRRRPSPPRAGADSYRVGSPAPRLAAPHWSSPTAVL